MSFIPNFQFPVTYYSEQIEIKNEPNRRKKFTPQEDEALKLFIYRIGSLNWKSISEYMPGRSAKQCRDRYFNYLSENITSEPWRKEEDQILLTMLSFIGPKWVEIARHIPGRSGNNVKNRWHKHLCKIYTYSPGRINKISKCIDIKTPNSSQIKEDQNEEHNECDDIANKYSIASMLI